MEVISSKNRLRRQPILDKTAAIYRRLGIIQGRLSPAVDNKIQSFPKGQWQNEFLLCKELGISCIEWIFEYDGAGNNPLCSDSGIREMLRVQQQYGVVINSVLADYFMVKKLFSEDKKETEEAISTLNFIITQCQLCHIPIIEIPFVDSSSLNTEKDKERAVHNLKQPLRYAQECGIKISMETSLAPKEFKGFIHALDSSAVGANYDTGNSASLGYDPYEEIDVLGEYIVNVHIKDRLKAAGTVPLGCGDTDFSAVFKALKAKNYRGDFMLQGARQYLEGLETKKDIKETICSYINFVKPFLREFA